MKTKTVSLRQCLKLIIDRRGVTPKKLKSTWKADGYKVLSANNVKSSRLQNTNQIRFVDADTYHKWMKTEIEKNDILLTSEAPAGEALLWGSDEKIVVGQRLYALRVRNTVNPWYLTYYLQSNRGQKEIQNKCSGSTVFGISEKMFDYIDVVLLDKTEQDKIASCIATLEFKIDNNKKIINQLESLAKTIYDYWFVQFDFPDKNGRPYKSSGGKMVWNERLQREIPDGWETDLLSSLAYFVTKKQDIGILNENNYISNDNLINDMGGIKPSQYLPNVISATEFITRDILLGNIRPYFHKMWLSDREGGCSADVLVIRAKNQILSEYLYYALGNKSFFDYDMAGSKGSKMPRGDKTHIMNFLICYREDLAIKFSEIVKPFITQISYLHRENQQLASLREFLLPLLMNGQVSFKSDSI